MHFIPSQHTVKFSFFLKLRFILPFIYLGLGKFLFLSKYIKETLSTVIYGDLGTMKSGKGPYFSYSLFLKALEIFLIWSGFKKNHCPFFVKWRKSKSESPLDSFCLQRSELCGFKICFHSRLLSMPSTLDCSCLIFWQSQVSSINEIIK